MDIFTEYVAELFQVVDKLLNSKQIFLLSTNIVDFVSDRRFAVKCESKQLIHYLKQLCSTFREDVHACEHHLLYDAQRHKMFVDGRKICCKL